MPQALIGAVAAPVAGALGGALFGGTKPSATQAVPPQLQGLNTNSINMLNYLLGFGGNPQQGQPGTQWMGSGQNPALGGRPSPYAQFTGGGSAPGGYLTNAMQRTRNAPSSFGPGSGPMGGALGQLSGRGGQGQGGGLFPMLGQPTTDLQRQSLGGISQFLNQPAPEQRALDMSTPFIGNLLKNNPGQGVLDMLQPLFNRNLAAANQQGGRFGSQNAILRSRALEDFNLLGAQVAQQGVQQQLQGANTLGLLSQYAGQGPFNRLGQAYGIGQSQAGQQDVGLQRALQLLTQGAFGQPTVVSPSGLQQGAQLGGSVGQILAMLPYLQQQQPQQGLAAAPNALPFLNGSMPLGSLGWG